MTPPTKGAALVQFDALEVSLDLLRALMPVIAKIRRQKRKRSRRAKLRLLADKRHRAEKKSLREPVRPERYDD